MLRRVRHRASRQIRFEVVFFQGDTCGRLSFSRLQRGGESEVQSLCEVARGQDMDLDPSFTPAV